MARKSPWQEFADNFNSVYGTFQKVGRDIETSRLMDDEKFTAKGGLGFGLEGDALEAARYKALGDIYTKYGDADKGLAVRQQLANLEEKKRSNELNRRILENQVNIQGKLAERMLESSIRDTDASAGLKGSQSAQINQNMAFKKQEQPLRMDSLLLQNQGLTLSNTAQDITNQSNRLQLEQDKIVKPKETKTKLAQNEVAFLESQNLIASNNLQYENIVENLKASISQARETGSAADLKTVENNALLAFTKSYQNGAFEDGEEAARAYASTIGAFDPGRAAKYVNEYTTQQVQEVAVQGMKITADVNGLIQKNDFDGIEKYFDDLSKPDVDGNVKLIRATDGSGGARLVELNAAGEEIAVIAEGKDRVSLKASLENAASFGNATAFSEMLFERKKGEALLKKTEVETEYQETINDTQRYSTMVKNNSIIENTKLAKAQANKLIQETASKQGLSWSQQKSKEAFADFIKSAGYTALAQQLDTYELNLFTKQIQMQLGLIDEPRGGIKLEAWLNMSEAQRSLF